MAEAFVTNDLFSDAMFASGGDPERPRVVITLIPLGCGNSELVPVVHTLDAAHDPSTIRVPVEEHGSVFKIVIEAPGFHEEHYRYLANGGQYCYTRLFDCSYIRVDALVALYHSCRGVVNRYNLS